MLLALWIFCFSAAHYMFRVYTHGGIEWHVRRMRALAMYFPINYFSALVHVLYLSFQICFEIVHELKA
jgi:hypothetical protein